MSSKKVKVLRVIDGDTVEVLAGRGLFHSPRSERIRLYGIDAPETSQRGGKEATRHLQRLIGSGGGIWLDRKGTDQYGRTIGLIHRKKHQPQESFNYLMVRDGQARCYMVQPEEREQFQEAEKEASEQRRGIWKNREETAPWEYRREARRRAQRRGKMKLILVIAIALVVLISAGYITLSDSLPALPFIR